MRPPVCGLSAGPDSNFIRHIIRGRLKTQLPSGSCVSAKLKQVFRRKASFCEAKTSFPKEDEFLQSQNAASTQ